MHTVGTARSWAIGEFKRAHVEPAGLPADLLLAYVLGWDRIRVLSRPEQSLEEEAWIRYQALVRRSAKGEPLQYLTGQQEFYGLLFQVTPDVLIPRPETELLVEEALSLIRRLLLPEIRFLDIGTGSGCIAVSVAHEFSGSVGWAVDISAAALRIARNNAVRHGVAPRIQFVQADLLECFPLAPVFHFILSNPPYVAREEYDSLPAAVKYHEPRGALFGGENGLETYRRLIPGVASRLVPGGYLLLELGAGQQKSVGQLVETGGLSLLKVLNDLQGIPRCLVARKSPLG
jgi:release factor glutamine methyltransferase